MPRWLDQAQTAGPAVAAMETRLYTGKESDASWYRPAASVAIGHQRAWPMVERRRLAHERRLSQILVRPYGVGFVAGNAATSYLCFMNRRMPNGTSCGVGGRRERSRLLPDNFTNVKRGPTYSAIPLVHPGRDGEFDRSNCPSTRPGEESPFLPGSGAFRSRIGWRIVRACG